MQIGVIGLGKLGLPLAVVLAKHFKVCGVDVNPKRVQQILNHERSFEPHVNEYLEKFGNNLIVTTDYCHLENCDLAFIITQTPSLPFGKFDLRYVESSLKDLHMVNSDCLAVVSSTINVGDIDKLRQTHKRIAYNPEFIKQGSIIHDFENPEFVLIGAYDKKDGETITNMWRKFHDKPAYVVKPNEAEIIKLSLNMSFTLGITFANIIGELCEKYKADSNKVLEIIYQDRRNYKPGLGYMGPCFPRDVNCFKAIAVENSVESAYRFADLLNELNDYTIERYLYKIKSYNKKKVGFLGVAYKPNVPYIYESQPIQIAQKLLYEGYEIYIHDPLAQENAKRALNGEAQFCSTVNECLQQVDVIFIGTMNHTSIKTGKPVVNPWTPLT